MNKIITIEYRSSILTPIGLHEVLLTALAEKISGKRAKVIVIQAINGESVLAINGESIGSNKYNTDAARLEVGEIKNLSDCELR